MNKTRFLYAWERSYPHIIAMVITITLTGISFNPIKSKQIDSLVEGIVTLDSIIIGFIGAIIPVILSMKNESKLVQYVFDRDKDGLFKKYISETIGYGLIDACVSLSIYTRDVIENTCILKILDFLFIYLLLLFLLSTYRGMACMLKLIFSNDKNIQEEAYCALDDSDRKKLWEQKGSKK